MRPINKRPPAIFVILALLGGIMSNGKNFHWDMWGAIFAGAMLLLYIAWEPARYWYRKYKFKYPCKAYFHIRESKNKEYEFEKNILYVNKPSNEHHVKELVVPSNSLIEIEVLYYPTIYFEVHETVFGCEGERGIKPEAEKRISSFIEKGKKEWVPGIDEGEMINRSGHYYYRSKSLARTVGDCFTAEFKLRTHKAGVYKTSLLFFTNERSCGISDLVIRVEDNPSTKMQCEIHQGCYIKPISKPE